MDGVAVGGSIVIAGLVLFVFSVVRTLRTANRIDVILIAFGCAAGWLAAAMLAGLLLALNLRFGWWAMDVLALLRAHAHIGVAGFFLTLIQGAMFRLVPMFTLGVVRKLRNVGLALALSQLGLLVLAPALAWQRQEAQIAGATLLLASFALTARELRTVLATRKKRVLESGLWGFLFGLILLMVAALGGAALIFATTDLRTALAYGVVAVLGGVLASVEGMLCKIVPFLIWMRVYGPRVGRQRIPQATELGRASFERVWLFSHGISVLALAIGAGFGKGTALGCGAVAFAASQGALFTSLVSAAMHLLRPAKIGSGPVALVKGII
jgi:hypothetical protein